MNEYEANHLRLTARYHEAQKTESEAFLNVLNSAIAEAWEMALASLADH